jgi:apoptosis-inducing factor 3
VPLIQGYNLNNVYTLRNHLDLEKIKQASMSAKKIVIVGASFIGMEMSSTLKKLNPKAEIILIDSDSAPFEKTLGREIGQAIQR